MASVFGLFKETSYSFLKIARGGVLGNTVTQTTPSYSGIFKLRSGMTRSPGEMEISTTAATLHVHPEDFASAESLVGNGVLVDGKTYEIAGVVEGRDFDTGALEFYLLTLEVADYGEISSNQ